MGATINGDDQDDQFGVSVSMSDDGSIVAIGATTPNNSGGYVRVYKYDGDSNAWNQIGNTISGVSRNSHFGYSVSLSSEGSIVGIAAPFDYGGINEDIFGKVRVFELQPCP